VTNFFHRDSFKTSTNANTDGWGNKLVTIFARHLDSFIMTINFSHFCQLFSGSGQILQPRQFYLSPGFAKIAPWWLARRDNFSAKVPGLVSADCATNVYSLNRRAVRRHSFGAPHAVFAREFVVTIIICVFYYIPDHILPNLIMTDNFQSLCGTQPSGLIFHTLTTPALLQGLKTTAPNS
jgi:hypothetical protein